ncbi:MAG: intradiol ring-cleavage dioxygenase [Alphaproteobacteria bacterium]|nr:intradiol ring-cleavage dioxygenase [Alphaproteobacteria bacterium]
MTPIPRRPVLRAIAAVTTVAILPARAADRLVATPRQTAGPFYPARFPDDVDNDLVAVAGRHESAQGQILHLVGRVLDRDGQPMRGARVEIWQCDVHGRYHHVEQGWQTARIDENFQGFGRTAVADDGSYRFRTIRPVPYSGRTAHIHLGIAGDGIERLITQMYVAGEPGNAGDPVLRAIRDERDRAAVIVALEPMDGAEPNALRARFDIVLG